MPAINIITCHFTPGLCQCHVIWNTKNTHKYNAMHTNQAARITLGKTKNGNDSATEEDHYTGSQSEKEWT